MARRNTNAELWKRVSAVGIFRDTSGGDSTTVAGTAPSAGDTTFDVASGDGSNYAADDYVRIGGAGDNLEVVKIEGVTTDTITTVSPLAFDHAVGEAVADVTSTTLGDITEDGVTQEVQPTRNEIASAIKYTPYGFLLARVNQRVSFTIENISKENLAAAFGKAESFGGAGTSADPYVTHIRGEDVASEDVPAVWFTGVMKNGETFEVWCQDANLDPSKTINFVTGNLVGVPFVYDFNTVSYFGPTP